MDNAGKHINTLWSADGCISPSALSRYIDNLLTKEERNAIEGHTAHCELCADALEGSMQIKNGESFISTVASLNKKIKNLTLKNKKPLLVPILSVAASLVILIGLFFLFHTRGVNKTLVAENMEPSKEQLQSSEPQKELKGKKEQVPHIKDEIKEDRTARVEKTTLQSVENNLGSANMTEENPVVMDKKDDMAVIEEELKNVPEALVISNDEEIVVQAVKEEEIMVESKKLEEKPVSRLEVSGYGEIEYENGKKVELFNKGNRAKSAAPAVEKQADNYVEMEEVPAGLYNNLADSDAKPDLYIITDVMPTFHEGDTDKFIEWIYHQLEYPDSIKEKDVQGLVIISFMVSKDGKVKEVKVVKSLFSEFDTKVVKIISSSPKWEPGKQNGIPVDIIRTISVKNVRRN